MEKILITTAEELNKKIETVTKYPSGGKYLSIGRADEVIEIDLNQREHLNFYKILQQYPKHELNTLEFLSCHFKSSFQLNSEYRNSNLPNLSFNFNLCHIYGITMSESVIQGKLKFRKCKFERSLYVYNTIYKGYVEFFNCTFNQRVRFVKSKFEDTVVFTKSIFEKNAFFTYTRFNDFGIFNRANFKLGLDLSQSTILKELSFNGVDVDNFSTVPITQDDELFEKTVSDGKIPTINKKETFRIIRNNLLKSNNKLESVRYDYLERLSYEQFLSESGKKWYDGDMLIFSLNRLSNKHRHSFKQGVKFTLFVVIALHFLSLLMSGNFEFATDDFWKHFPTNIKGIIISLNPAHSIKSLKELYRVDQFGVGFYAFNYISRIFVGYGIYQTIQAFRKFK